MNKDNVPVEVLDLTRWLTRSVMEYHNLRQKILSECADDNAKAYDMLWKEFPFLQGLSNHRQFKEIGGQKINNKNITIAKQWMLDNYKT